MLEENFRVCWRHAESLLLLAGDAASKICLPKSVVVKAVAEVELVCKAVQDCPGRDDSGKYVPEAALLAVFKALTATSWACSR
jgi:hypothetical protein